MDLSAAAKKSALEVGFDLVGIAPISAWKDLEFARAWLKRGYGGEMHYLRNPKRDDPRRALPSARSVVCVGMIYNTAYAYSTEVAAAPLTRPRGYPLPNQGRGAGGEGDTPRAWISRYAWGRDYHEVMRRRLEKLRATIEGLAPHVETRAYVDTGPIVERAFARLSGIGWMGKNTCIINEAKGSWFFLGVILTDLELAPDLPAPDRCGSCTRCIEACPTGALVEPYVMDASRCIAYFTIELKGSIPTEFRPAIGANLFGCDICQDVCPWNGGSQKLESRRQKPEVRTQESEVGSQNRSSPRRGASTTAVPEFQPMQIDVETQSVSSFHFPVSPFSFFNPPLEALASMSEADFRRAFHRSPIKRLKYCGWLRNLCVTMGNSGNARLIPKLKELCDHPDAVVREHAAWALARLEVRQRCRAGFVL